MDAERRSALTALQELGACPRPASAGSIEDPGPGNPWDKESKLGVRGLIGV